VLSPYENLEPSFNQMVLFATSDAQQKWHMVTPVAAIAPDDAWRLAVSGWFLSSEPDGAKAGGGEVCAA
jgi:Rps23 Pro-64 3,4-dihydroxylase Tpa1-like proline 4-hydroxylase